MERKKMFERIAREISSKLKDANLSYNKAGERYHEVLGLAECSAVNYVSYLAKFGRSTFSSRPLYPKRHLSRLLSLFEVLGITNEKLIREASDFYNSIGPYGRGFTLGDADKGLVRVLGNIRRIGEITHTIESEEYASAVDGVEKYRNSLSED